MRFRLMSMFTIKVVRSQLEKSSIELMLSVAANGADSRVFITFPRFRDGIPITLGVRSLLKANDGSQLIEPYPNYSWHLNPTQHCSGRMVSVYRIAVRNKFLKLCNISWQHVLSDWSMPTTVGGGCWKARLGRITASLPAENSRFWSQHESAAASIRDSQEAILWVHALR